MAAEVETYELPLGEDIERLELGFSKMCVTKDLKIIRLYNGGETHFEASYHAKNLDKTVKAVVEVLISSHQCDDKLKIIRDVFAPLLSNRLIELKRKLLEEAQRKKGNQRQQEEKSSYEKAQEAKILKWKEIVERVKNDNIGIS